MESVPAVGMKVFKILADEQHLLRRQYFAICGERRFYTRDNKNNKTRLISGLFCRSKDFVGLYRMVIWRRDRDSIHSTDRLIIINALLDLLRLVSTMVSKKKGGHPWKIAPAQNMACVIILASQFPT
jgi:hypothetical protein